MKKVLTMLVVVCMVVTMFVPVMAAQEDIKVTINDKPVVFTESPVMENDRILVPIRAIAEDLLFDVDWDDSLQKITLENFNTRLTFYIGQDTIEKTLTVATDEYEEKYQTIKIDVPAKIIDERTYIPLRAISELFGADVDWDPNTSTAKLTYALTKGDVVTFEDEGIEYHTRLAITLQGIDSSIVEKHYGSDEMYLSFNIERDLNFIAQIFNDQIKLYSGEIHEGVLSTITNLGLPSKIMGKFPKTVRSLKDITKFPNLENIFLEYNLIEDISPITYKKDWDFVLLGKNPITDLTPLSKINVNKELYINYYNQEYSYYSYDPTYPDYKDFTNSLVQMDKVVKDVINERITPDMTREEKIAEINDWIINNIKYDYDEEYIKWKGEDYHTFLVPLYSHSTNADPRLSLECALLYKYAVCEGYTMTFEHFCDILNIPCAYVKGTVTYNSGDIQKHAWNIVELENGERLYVDTTWNVSDNNYFLVTSDELNSKHSWDESEANKSLDEKKEDLERYEKYGLFDRSYRLEDESQYEKYYN